MSSGAAADTMPPGAYPELSTEETPVPVRPMIPRNASPELQEYLKSDLRIVATTHTAVKQLKLAQDHHYRVFGEQLQELHAVTKFVRTEQAQMDLRVQTMATDVQEIRGTVAAVRSGVDEIAEHLGRFVGEVYGSDAEQTSDIEALSASQADANTKVAQALAHANRARMESAAAKKESAEAKARADISDVKAKAAEKIALQARQLRRWQVGGLLAAGPVAWKLFEALYPLLH